MTVRVLLSAFLILLSLTVGSSAGESQGEAPTAFDTLAPPDSSMSGIPKPDEFITVEVIAEMIHYEPPNLSIYNTKLSPTDWHG